MVSSIPLAGWSSGITGRRPAGQCAPGRQQGLSTGYGDQTDGLIIITIDIEK
jgi:hypothetical protein